MVGVIIPKLNTFPNDVQFHFPMPLGSSTDSIVSPIVQDPVL